MSGKPTPRKNLQALDAGASLPPGLEKDNEKKDEIIIPPNNPVEKLVEEKLEKRRNAANTNSLMPSGQKLSMLCSTPPTRSRGRP